MGRDAATGVSTGVEEPGPGLTVTTVEGRTTVCARYINNRFAGAVI